MKRILSLFIIIIILFAIAASGQGTQIRNLPAASSVNSGDMFPGDAFGGGTYKYTFSQLLGARTITCVPPLLCNGGATMDLAADRTLAIGGLSAPITPAAGGGTFFVKSGSSRVSATNEGLRPAMFSLFGQSATATQDNALMTIDSIQTDNSSTMHWTGLQVKVYSHVDNGGDISGILCASSGGGNCLTVVKASGLRPAGFANLYNETGPAAEFQSADWGPAAYFISGSGIGGNPQKNSAIIIGLGQSTGANQSGGVVIQPNDGVFDSRYALVVGTASGGAEPVNQKFSLFMSGDIKATNSTNDGSVRSWTFLKSRSGASINTNESLGDFNWNGINSASVEKPFGLFRVVAADKTSGSEDGDFVFYSTLNGSALTERGRLASTGNWTVTGALGGSNFSGTSSGTNTGDQIVPVNTTSTASNWLSAYNSATGAFTKSQPAFSDISSTATAAQTPLAVILGGASGGQIINGDTASGGNLTLHSTAHATKGKILIGTSVYDEANNRLGVGLASPLTSFVVSTNATALPAPTSGTIAQFSTVDGSNTRLEVDAYSGGAIFEGRQAQGTAASPTATQSTNILFNLTGLGYGATGFSSGGRAFIQAQGAENWSDTAQGTQIVIGTTENGTTSALTQLTLKDGGHVYVTGTSPSIACTGTGTSPTAPTVVGNDLAFKVTINTGTGSPASSGTCTVTYHVAYNSNSPIWACTMVSGASNWGNGANAQVTTESASAPVFTWYNVNNGALTALTISTSYKFSCINLGRLP